MTKDITSYINMLRALNPLKEKNGKCLYINTDKGFFNKKDKTKIKTIPTVVTNCLVNPLLKPIKKPKANKIKIIKSTIILPPL